MNSFSMHFDSKIDKIVENQHLFVSSCSIGRECSVDLRNDKETHWSRYGVEKTHLLIEKNVFEPGHILACTTLATVNQNLFEGH